MMACSTLNQLKNKKKNKENVTINIKYQSIAENKIVLKNLGYYSSALVLLKRNRHKNKNNI